MLKPYKNKPTTSVRHEPLALAPNHLSYFQNSNECFYHKLNLKIAHAQPIYRDALLSSSPSTFHTSPSTSDNPLIRQLNIYMDIGYSHSHASLDNQVILPPVLKDTESPLLISFVPRRSDRLRLRKNRPVVPPDFNSFKFPVHNLKPKKPRYRSPTKHKNLTHQKKAGFI